MVRTILAGLTSVLLAACTAQLSERHESLDDPSNPHAPEAAARQLPSTLAAESVAPPVPAEAAPPPHSHHHHQAPQEPPEKEAPK